MQKKSSKPSIHQRLEAVIQEMVEEEINLKDALHEFEKIYIETASKKYGGKMTRMAKALGVHRNTLRNRFRSLKVLPKN